MVLLICSFAVSYNTETTINKTKKSFTFVTEKSNLIAFIVATSKPIKINLGFKEMPNSAAVEFKVRSRSMFMLYRFEEKYACTSGTIILLSLSSSLITA